MKAVIYKIPIIFHIAYILFTLSINLFGPKIYIQYTNKLGMILYILAYLIAVYWGYCRGLKSKIYKREVQIDNISEKRMLPLLKTCIKVSCILLLINTVYLISIGKFSLNIGLMGQNYINFYEYYGVKSENSIYTFENIFILLIAIPQFIATCLGFLYYRHFSKRMKIYFWIFLFLIIAVNTISKGNQKSIGDIVILFLISVLYLMYTAPELRQKLKKWLLIIGVTFIALMSFSQLTRLNSNNITSVQELNSRMAGYASFDQDHIIFKIFGPKLGLGLSAFITGYLSDGYYGLSKSLELPFEWTYGVGGSYGLTNICEKIFDTQIYEKTYLGRMEQQFGYLGISGTRTWHTIFPWIASDLTFIGTLFFFFIMGYIYAKSWKEVLLCKNSISYLMFCLLTIMFIFVPANNQIFHGYNYILITLFVFIYWLRKHKYHNYYVRTVS